MSAGFDLAAALSAWDGRDVRPLADLAEQLPADHAHQDTLIAWAGEPGAGLAVPATWVLKAWCDAGLRPDRRRSGRLAALLACELPWEARLHVLQCLPALDLTATRWRALHPRLLAAADDERPFVRAWAFYGLGVGALALPELRPEVEALFARREDDEPASVSVRMRKARELWARSRR